MFHVVEQFPRLCGRMCLVKRMMTGGSPRIELTLRCPLDPGRLGGECCCDGSRGSAA